MTVQRTLYDVRNARCVHCTLYIFLANRLLYPNYRVNKQSTRHILFTNSTAFIHGYAIYDIYLYIAGAIQAYLSISKNKKKKDLIPLANHWHTHTRTYIEIERMRDEAILAVSMGIYCLAFRILFHGNFSFLAQILWQIQIGRMYAAEHTRSLTLAHTHIFYFLCIRCTPLAAHKIPSMCDSIASFRKHTVRTYIYTAQRAEWYNTKYIDQ